MNQMQPKAIPPSELEPTSPSKLKPLLQSWLKNRQSLIIQFNTLCQLRPFQLCKDHQLLDESIIGFCQTLIDYIAMGQFQIFEKLLMIIEQNGLATTETTQLFHRLKETTLKALEFSDQYTDPFEIEKLENDLCTIGEILATRFDLEDDVIGLVPSNTIKD